MSETDEQLLEALQRGNVAAFDELFLRHYQQVYQVVYRLVGGREQAEDLVQETFLALYDRPPTIDAGTSLIAWLCRVALNRGYNAIRSARREQERAERLAEPAVSLDPQAELLRAEERARVRVVLACLPERQSQLLSLRYAGFSYAEIAAIIDIAPGSVGTLLARAERAFLAAYEQTEQNHAML